MNEPSLKERLIEVIGNMSEDQQRTLLDFLEKPQREYRKYPRKPCSIATDYTISNRTYKDFIENISAGGVYVKTTHPQSINQEVSMTFMLVGHSKPITVTGNIVRVGDQGFAVKFYRELQEYFAEMENKIKAEIGLNRNYQA